MHACLATLFATISHAHHIPCLALIGRCREGGCILSCLTTLLPHKLAADPLLNPVPSDRGGSACPAGKPTARSARP